MEEVFISRIRKLRFRAGGAARGHIVISRSGLWFCWRLTHTRHAIGICAPYNHLGVSKADAVDINLGTKILVLMK